MTTGYLENSHLRPSLCLTCLIKGYSQAHVLFLHLSVFPQTFMLLSFQLAGCYFGEEARFLLSFIQWWMKRLIWLSSQKEITLQPAFSWAQRIKKGGLISRAHLPGIASLHFLKSFPWFCFLPPEKSLVSRTWCKFGNFHQGDTELNG